MVAEGPPPSKYDPLAIVIGDTHNVMGVQLRDPSDYHVMGPYQGIYADDGNMMTNITYIKSSEKEQDYKRQQSHAVSQEKCVTSIDHTQ